MAIDTSIYGNIRLPQTESYSPLDSLTKAMSLGDLALKSRQMRQDYTDQSNIRAAFAKNVGPDGNVNRAGVLSDLAKTSPLQAMDYKTKFAQMDASQAEAQKKVLEDNLNKFSTAYRLASTATDQGSYDSMKKEMAGMGLPVDHLPPQFSPQWRDQMRNKSALMVLDATKGLEALKTMSDVGIKEAAAPLDREKTMSEIAKNIAETGKIKNENKSAKPEELLAGGFARRMEQAEGIIGKLNEKGFDRSAAGASAQSWLPGSMQSEDRRMHDQAENNFISAVLRKESGAAISNSEREAEGSKYFPRSGDTPEVLSQKAAARAQAIANMKASAGRGYDLVPVATVADGAGVPKKNGSGLINEASASDKRPSTSQVKAPKPGSVEDGFVFMGGDPSKQSSWKKAR